jgi:hypothetical protein
MNVIEIFLLLQVLDFMSTLIGIRLGGTELSPFANFLMGLHHFWGLTAVKAIGFVMAGYCVWSRRLKVIGWFNYASALIVVWNLLNIMRAVSALSV